MEPYRPMILQKEATNCPKCGRPIIERDRCWLCQQPFCAESALPPADPVILYIAIFTVWGWSGMGPTLFIAVNTATREYAAEMASQEKKTAISLSDEMIDELASQAKSGQLFNKKFPKDNTAWYDVSSYTIRLQKGDMTSTHTFWGEQLKQWPVFDRLLNEIFSQ